jgi:hypothetical protein
MAAIAKPIRASRRMRARLDAAARLAGCTCKPEHVLAHWAHDRLQYMNSHHDDGCPALDVGRLVVVMDGPS